MSTIKAKLEVEAIMDYCECGHCHKRVSTKTFKEHQRLYYHEGKWIERGHETCELDSRSSSPMTLSDPASSTAEVFDDVPVNLYDDNADEFPNPDISDPTGELLYT